MFDRILTAVVWTVWHIQPHHKCDFIDKFSASGTTKVEIRKL